MAGVPEFAKPFMGRFVRVYLCGETCPEPERHDHHVAVGTLESVNEYGEGTIVRGNGEPHLYVWPVMRVEEVA